VLVYKHAIATSPSASARGLTPLPGWCAADLYRAVAPLAALLAAVSAVRAAAAGRPTRAAVPADLRDFLPEPGQALTGSVSAVWSPLHAGCLAARSRARSSRRVDRSQARASPRAPRT